MADNSTPGDRLYVGSSSDTLRDNETNNQEKGDAENGVAKKGGVEKGGQEGPQMPVGFFDTRLNKVRLQVFRNWGLMVFIICAFILTVLSIFWAVLFHVERNLSSLTIFVVNFETGSDSLLGPFVTNLTENIVRENLTPRLGYTILSPEEFDNDPMLVREAVYDQSAYAAVVVNPNATTLLRQAVDQSNSSYDPLGAMQIIYTQARDEQSYSNYITPQLNSLSTEIISSFGEMWVRMVLENETIPRENLVEVPQALSPAVGFSTFNLRPFTPPVSTPAVTIGLIYLIIIAFFSFMFFLPIHMKFMQTAGHPPLKFNHLIAWRWFSTITAYLFMSLAYSLVSLAFQVPFSNPSAPHTEVAANANGYGRASFVVYWMVNWIGMASLGLPCENMAMIVGTPWTSFWLIFWVILNVATSFYSLDLAPGFFRWGYAWPLRNIVEASRVVIFDVNSRIGVNFGVIFAWAAVSTILFPFCCYFMRWKTMRQMKKGQ